MWEIATRPRFDDWYWTLSDLKRTSIQASLIVLAEKGAQLVYKKMIPIADAEFDDHLEELKYG